MVAVTETIADVQPATVSLYALPKLDFLWLELTEKCNLRCQHCYVSSSPDLPLHGNLQHQDWLAAIREAASLGCKSLQFIGGEPLLYPKIDELIDEACGLDFNLIEIYTNGTPITRSRAEYFSKAGIRIACSFYSADAVTHDAVTQKAGSFTQTVAALQHLRAAGVSLRIGFIEMEVNKGHFGAAVEFLHGLGITNIRKDSIRGFGRGEEQVVRHVTNKNKFDGLCGQCSKDRLCLTSSGAVSPCPMSRDFVVGNYLDSNLHGVLAAAALSTFQNDMNREFGDPRSGRVVNHCVPKGPAPEDVPPCRPGDVPCMVCGPGNCNPDFACDPDGVCPICFPGLCIPG